MTSHGQHEHAVHGHAHGHAHGHRPRRAGARELRWALIITAVMTVAEFIGGYFSGSLALISDAGHMLTDTLALGLSLAAVSLASRPATPRRSFGFLRMEVLAALVNGVTLVLLAGYIFWEAWARLKAPPQIHTGIMLVVAWIGLGANAAGVWLLHGAGGHNVNVRGAFLHVLGDLLSSVAVIVAGFVIYATGWTAIDPILSVLIGLVILFGAFRLLNEAVDVLMESVPSGVDITRIRDALLAIATVKDVHDLHVWSLTSGVHALSAHLVVVDQMTAQSDRVLSEAAELLCDRFGVAHTTLQIEAAPCEPHSHGIEV